MKRLGSLFVSLGEPCRFEGGSGVKRCRESADLTSPDVKKDAFGTLLGSFFEHFGPLWGGKFVTFCEHERCRVQKVVPSGSEEGRSAF